MRCSRRPGLTRSSRSGVPGFYAATMGRPSLAPAVYFRLLLIGYFEGHRFRARDRLAGGGFAGLARVSEAGIECGAARSLDDFAHAPADRSGDPSGGVPLGSAARCRGEPDERQTLGVDATTLEANAAMRSIVRRDTGDSYQEFLTELAQASGMATPTRADLARVDRKRKKKGSNDDWTHPA